MKRIHMRLSVEIEVTDEQFECISQKVHTSGGIWDINCSELPLPIQSDISEKKFTPCNWDDGGYIPAEWFAADCEEQKEE